MSTGVIICLIIAVTFGIALLILGFFCSYYTDGNWKVFWENLGRLIEIRSKAIENKTRKHRNPFLYAIGSVYGLIFATAMFYVIFRFVLGSTVFIYEFTELTPSAEPILFASFGVLGITLVYGIIYGIIRTIILDSGKINPQNETEAIGVVEKLDCTFTTEFNGKITSETFRVTVSVPNVTKPLLAKIKVNYSKRKGRKYRVGEKVLAKYDFNKPKKCIIIRSDETIEQQRRAKIITAPTEFPERKAGCVARYEAVDAPLEPRYDTHTYSTWSFLDLFSDSTATLTFDNPMLSEIPGRLRRYKRKTLLYI